MLLVHLTSLREGIQEQQFTPAPEEVDLDPAVFADVHVDLRIDATARRILIDLDASATAHLTCDRTLVPFTLPVSGTHQLLYTTEADSEATDDAEVHVYPLSPGDRTLDLTEAVRDTLVLALPLRRIAPEAENVDLNLRYGTPAEEDAIDPRWAALKKLSGG